MGTTSVVIPTYNRAHLLERSVSSVLRQTYGDIELIIVDDGSTDQTRARVSEFQDSRIKYLYKENGGVSSARNMGIKHASGRYVGFLDSDDAYCSRRLSLPLAVLDREPDVVCTLSSSRKEDKHGQGRAAPLPDIKLAAPAFAWAMLADLIGVESTSITVRTEHAKKAGGFDPALRRTEDREFLIRLARLGALRVLPDVLFEKSWSADGLSNEWAGAGRDLIPYFRARPEYLGAYRKLGHYFATKILVMHVRHRDVASFIAEVRRFRAAGLLDAGIVRLWHDHLDVKDYRRAHATAEALAALAGPPTDWA